MQWASLFVLDSVVMKAMENCKRRKNQSQDQVIRGHNLCLCSLGSIPDWYLVRERLLRYTCVLYYVSHLHVYWVHDQAIVRRERLRFLLAPGLVGEVGERHDTAAAGGTEPARRRSIFE